MANDGTECAAGAVPVVESAAVGPAMRQLREALHARRCAPEGPSAAHSAAELVSVVVLNFNGAAVLARCLDQLLAQSYRRVEILVVDNNSADDSGAILEAYRARGVVAIRSPTNLGVPGGRNLGLRHTNGAYVAFIDADGFADREWLAQCVQVLESSPDVGAVAPLVYFDSHPLVMNGAGGTVNRRGYGGDHCYHAPYEFAEIPTEVLYPMGCGMVIRRNALGRTDFFDALPVKWYEDVELGVRLWGAGYRVLVAPAARVDHGYGHSDAFLPDRVYMCERARIRTVLKYFPARELPRWLRHEREALRASPPEIRRLLRAAWRWNLRHLASSLRLRLGSRGFGPESWRLVDSSWGQFPPPVAPSGGLHPDPSRWGPRLAIDGTAELPQLNFGWFGPETYSDGAPFRWTAPDASALFCLDHRAERCVIRCAAALPDTEARIAIRAFGTLHPLVSAPIVGQPGVWHNAQLDQVLAPGRYEVLIQVARPFPCPSGRKLGLAITSIAFE
jgi:GT2 family glycosyltransferase